MEKKNVKTCKKAVNILRIAATDKENVTSKMNKKKMNSNQTIIDGSKDSGGKRLKKEKDTNTKTKTNITNINEMKSNYTSQPDLVLETDLTVDNPSEKYWECLAESRRKALDFALKENVDLHNKVNELEYENSRLKAMLDDAKALVEVLTEMVHDNDNCSNGNLEDSINDMHQQDRENSDSDTEDMSFQTHD